MSRRCLCPARSRVATFAVAFLLPALAFALPGLVGYSGAPGTAGSCALHCHGSSGGSILVSGFPAEYVPGDTYRVRISHHGGEAISNLNASVRRANDTPNAGAIVPGPNMELYSAETDSVGVHFAIADQDSGWFLWIAPEPGLGNAGLYLSGMQGTSAHGLSTLIRLVAAEGPSSVEDGPRSGRASPWFEVVNRVATDYLILRWETPSLMPARIDIVGPAGRRAATLDCGTARGRQMLAWQPIDRLAPGSYFAVLVAGSARLTRRFAVVR